MVQNPQAGDAVRVRINGSEYPAKALEPYADDAVHTLYVVVDMHGAPTHMHVTYTDPTSGGDGWFWPE